MWPNTPIPPISRRESTCCSTCCCSWPRKADMSRVIEVAAAQMGPIQRDHSRHDVVERLIVLLRTAHQRGAQLVVFPELALTTFFPRWWVDDLRDADHFYET